MASGLGRLGAIAAPVLIGLIVSLKLPLEQNFLVIGAAGIVGALALACINHRLSMPEQHHDAKAMPTTSQSSKIAGAES
jgi:AAHS family benzoate transporter-like MFS transporter